MDETRLDEFDDQSFEEDEPEVAIDADVIDRLAAYTQELPHEPQPEPEPEHVDEADPEPDPSPEPEQAATQSLPELAVEHDQTSAAPVLDDADEDAPVVVEVPRPRSSMRTSRVSVVD